MSEEVKQKRQIDPKDVKTERDAEVLMKRTIEKHELDEWFIKLDGTKMDDYVYELKIKKQGWDDIEKTTYGKDDPDGAYIQNILYFQRHITMRAIAGG